MPVEQFMPKPEVRIRPLAGGRCKVEIDAVLDWGTAIEIMKVLGHFGQIATTGR
jgi:hypothetical protein